MQFIIVTSHDELIINKVLKQIFNNICTIFSKKIYIKHYIIIRTLYGQLTSM